MFHFWVIYWYHGIMRLIFSSGIAQFTLCCYSIFLIEPHSHDIFSTKFDGKNYPIRKFYFRIFVQGKSSFWILNGSTTNQNEGKEKQVWHANNACVILWILNSVHVNITLCLLYLLLLNLASEMCKHLKKVYFQCNRAHDFKL